MAKVNDSSKTRAIPRVSLPDLTPFEGERLEIGCDYEAASFTDLDFSAQDASDSRFMECRLERCAVDGLSLRQARFADCMLIDVHGTSLDASNSVWRNCEITRGRLGALTLAAATWTSLRCSGVKFGFVYLAGAHLDEVIFEDCDIGSLDAGAARLRSVTFVRGSIRELYVADAILAKVDLSATRVEKIVGIEGIRGTIISRQQLVDLAPSLAAQLGVEVRPD